MSNTTRRDLLGVTGATAALAACGIVTRPGDAAEFRFKYANNNVAAHPMNVRLRQAIERIREETGGRMEIVLFPNSQLGGDTGMLAQLRIGAIQMLNMSGLILSTYVPIASINGIAFAFRDYTQVWAAMDGALGAYVRGAIEKASLHVFKTTWDNGYRQVTSSTHPIVEPRDFRGFKIRVPISPLWTSTFKALGASPTSINVNEIYSALQTKIVEGQENPLSLIDLFRLYEVQKYVSFTNHMWDGFFTLANARYWAALPADIQEIVARNINGAARQEREDIRQLNKSLEAELGKKGMVFNRTDTDKFRAAMRDAGFYAEWKRKYGPAWAVLEQEVGALG